MKQLFTIILCSCLPFWAIGQHNFKCRVTDKSTKEPLPGAVVHVVGTALGAAADAEGFLIITDVPDGRLVIQVQSTGYEEKSDTFTLPLPASDTFQFLMEAKVGEMDEVTVSSTRSSRTILDNPTRVELISGEELAEKANMKPGDIRMMLSESTGIQTLQTSAASGNSAIRIQGLDGRYTQVLKDGFPLYAGFSGGLGLMQTPPLDLRRVEIVKGPSSTLYGGGAIAGLINLISKTPANLPELRLLLNVSSAGGLDLNGFYSRKFKKFGITCYAARNSNNAYAPDHTVFSAIPQFARYTFNPKFFFNFSERTEFYFGVNTSIEDRLGGDIYYIRGKGDSLHAYYEDNRTRRASTETELKHKLLDGSVLTFRNSISYFKRVITTPGYLFDGTQLSSFSEASYFKKNKHTEWTAGLNLFSDRFTEVQQATLPSREYLIVTYGAFVQNVWDVNTKLAVESGLRIDYVSNYNAVLLPRISVLYKFNRAIASRLGGGLGYKAPTIFTEESERINYRNVLPAFWDKSRLERAFGANWDVNYKTTLAHGKVAITINELLFYSQLEHALLLTNVNGGIYQFQNIDAHFETRGAETNVKIAYRDFKLFLGYTFTHSHIRNGDIFRENPLTPRDHINSVLMYELEGKWKVGIEGYYFSEQRLSDGATGRDYWLCGFMAEKFWRHCSVYVNFENILDSRQTRYEQIYTGSIANPSFRDIYAPLDGFVFNGGVKWNL